MNTRSDRIPPADLYQFVALAAITARRHRRVIAAASLVAAAWVIVSTAMTPPQYRAEAEVTALFDDDRGASMAFDIAGATDVTHPGLRVLVTRPRGRLFPLVLASRDVSERVLSATYRYHDGKRLYTEDLYDWVGTRNRDAGVVILKNRVAGFYLNPETGATRIAVTTTSPELSWQIAERYVRALDEVLNGIRERSIEANAAAIRDKMEETGSQLQRAETEMERLRRQNRDYASLHDPAFHIEELRIEREVAMHGAVMVALRAQYELTMSRMFDRNRRITVVTAPDIPTRSIAPAWGRSLLLAALLALLSALVATAAIAVADCAAPAAAFRWKAMYRVLRADVRLLWMRTRSAT